MPTFILLVPKMSSYRQGEIQKHLTFFPMLNVFLEYPGGGLGIYTDTDL